MCDIIFLRRGFVEIYVKLLVKREILNIFRPDTNLTFLKNIRIVQHDFSTKKIWHDKEEVPSYKK